MKIDNSLKSVGSVNSDSSTSKSSKTESPKPQAGVSVALSDLSSQLQALDAHVTSGGVVDAARVSEIKQAISEGRFKVNPDVVADRLLQTVQELISAYKQ